MISAVIRSDPFVLGKSGPAEEQDMRNGEVE